MFKKVTVSLISLCLLFTILGAGNYNQENYDTNNQKNVLSNLLVFKSNVAKAKRSGPIGKAKKKNKVEKFQKRKEQAKIGDQNLTKILIDL